MPDSCIYVSITETLSPILGIYVDDGLLALTDNLVIEKMIKFLKEFELHVVELSCFVGMQVNIESKDTLNSHIIASLTYLKSLEYHAVKAPGSFDHIVNCN